MFRKPDLGILIIRIVFGLVFVYYGASKFANGAAGLEGLGSTMKVFGITAYPLVFGILAAAFELIGGILVILGYKFRWGVLAILLIMVIGVIVNFDGLPSIVGKAFLTLQMAGLFLGLLFIGPGKYSFDRE